MSLVGTLPNGDQLFRTNYSLGYVVEYVDSGDEPCESWLLIPAENLWSMGFRGFLYLFAMLYMFVGIAIISDIFVGAIEVITSQSRVVVKYDEERGDRVEKQVLVWNETVANLSLMALGSSAPEIMLAVGEACQNLGSDDEADSLGTFTIIGSAAFNLLVITAVCIASVGNGEIKGVREFGVFIVTSIWSIFAYLWIIVVVEFQSKGEIEIWEAFVTLGFFPLLILNAYAQDNGWWCRKNQAGVGVDASSSHPTVRVVNRGRSNSIMHGMAPELAEMERRKSMRVMSQLSLKNIEEGDRKNSIISYKKDGDMLSAAGSQGRLVSPTPHPTAQKARARFRHAAVRSMLGGKRHHHPHKPKFPEVVETVQMTGAVSNIYTFPNKYSEEDLLGKFTFASPSYAVLESAGILEIDVLFHRAVPPKSSALMNGNGPQTNGKPTNGKKETTFTEKGHNGTVQVHYETREGSGKIGKDFEIAQGPLIFEPTEYKKTITVGIINDNQYEADVDFYVILKQPSGDAGLGDPNVTRVTIIDDDEPGEFEFECPAYKTDGKNGALTTTVIRQKGCDGTVRIEYSTIDGTAKGDEKLSGDFDYRSTTSALEFKHGETKKPITIDVTKRPQGTKNFILTLRNPSLGAKIGSTSAAICYIQSSSSDDLDERLAGIVDDDEDEDVTWFGQFKQAMTLECEEDEDGNEVELGWVDFIMHFITFFWKVLFAFIPPRMYLGAWPTFVASILGIGALTIIVEQLGTLLGCVIGLKKSVAGITIIALGTSLPDTFASRTAALHDENADAAIGNVTGSNSVNVFLGLGLPWVISTLYGAAKGTPYKVATGNLVSSVIIFSIVGTITIFVLVLRRKFVGGELGGKNPVVKFGCATFLIMMWVLYVTLSSIKAYSSDSLPW